MRLVPIGSVREGTKLGKDIYNEKGSVLLKRGVVLNESLLQRIEDNKVFTVYVDDEYSDKEIEDIIRPELRQRAVVSLKETFDQIDKFNRQSKQSDDIKLREDLLIKRMEKYISCLKQVSELIVDEISSNRQIMINLVDIKNIDTYTYQHSLNTAILSIILGMEMKYRRDELFKLFFGALLHDIGKAFIPRSIIDKRGAYTEEEVAMIKEHPDRGYNYLKEFYGIPSPSKVVAIQHHEKYDGSGYPKGMSGTYIHKFSRIVAIADVYDSMTSDSPNSRALPPNEAIEYIMGAAGSHFDFEMASVFCRKVIPYPEGTLVNISTGQIAVIVSVNPNYPLRPRIKILKSGVHVNDLPVTDLLTVTDVTITGVEYKAPDSDVAVAEEELNIAINGKGAGHQ